MAMIMVAILVMIWAASAFFTDTYQNTLITPITAGKNRSHIIVTKMMVVMLLAISTILIFTGIYLTAGVLIFRAYVSPDILFLFNGTTTVAMSAIEINEFVELYNANRAKRYLESGKVVIIGGGTGDPYFTTDTAAALRAAELNVDAALMAKNIDGVYTADPKVDPTAVRYDELTYSEIIDKQLHAIDLTAACFCMENHITTYAFELRDPENIYRAVNGEKVGTEIHN